MFTKEKDDVELGEIVGSKFYIDEIKFNLLLNQEIKMEEEINPGNELHSVKKKPSVEHSQTNNQMLLTTHATLFSKQVAADVINAMLDNVDNEIFRMKIKRKDLEEKISKLIYMHFKNTHIERTWKMRMTAKTLPWDDGCLNYYDATIKQKSIGLYNLLVEYRKLGDNKKYRKDCEDLVKQSAIELDEGSRKINSISDSVKFRGRL